MTATIRHLSLPFSLNLKELLQHFKDASLPVLLNSGTTSVWNPTQNEKNKELYRTRENKRFEIFSCNPASIITGFETDDCYTQIIQKLQKFVTNKQALPSSEIQVPFISGAIGLLSYEANQIITKAFSTKKSNIQWPDICVGIYQWAIVKDNLNHHCLLVADPKLCENKWDSLVNTLSQIKKYPEPNEYFNLESSWECLSSKEEYENQFNRIKQYIENGDCYQTNLTRCFFTEYSGSIETAYYKLQKAIPAPFSVYFRHKQSVMISCSPERFIEIQSGIIKTQPIKGTRPRGNTPEEDQKLKTALSVSTKDKAENLMIVDLMRNDLGKIAKKGSVEVEELFKVKTYSNVHHLVSTITAELPENNYEHSLAVLFSCMPGGSITGAPKKRAMEIIDELEPHQRSIYCGTMFYINHNGDMNSNILIRSLLFENENNDEIIQSEQKKHPKGKIYCWGGGGIVADSNCENEYDESYYKISAILNTLETNRET